MKRNIGIATGATLLALVGGLLAQGVAVADDLDGNDIDQYSKDYERAHRGGDGSKGGLNKAECLVPLGLGLGLIASNGGPTDQCNSRGGNGGNGAAGDVDY